MNIFIFTGGDYPSPEDCQSFIENMASPDYVIAADSGLDTLKVFSDYYKGKYDFTPSLITGDMDSLKDKSLIETYSDCAIKRYPHDKDYSDTELALKDACLIPGNGSGNLIVLIGGDGGRLDHLIGILDTFNSLYKADYWLCKENLLTSISKGQKLFIKNLDKEDRLSVINPCCGELKITTSGLKWGGNLFKSRSLVSSLSNRIDDETLDKKKEVILNVLQGHCLVISPLQTIMYKEVTYEK